MNSWTATKEVIKIVNSKDNIIDQLKELRKYAYRKGVRKYIDTLIGCNITRYYDIDSQYILYCIVKYFYGLDAKKVKEPAPTLSIITPGNYDIDLISSFLDSKDNIVDQCKLLREHNDLSDVQDYITQAEAYYGYDSAIAGLPTDYERYCIDKYYYGLDVPEVKPSHVRLYAYERMRRVKEVYEEDISGATPLENIKEGDRIKMLNGPFKNISGVIVKTNLDNNEFTINFHLFEEETIIDLDYQYNKFIKIDDDNE